MTCDERQHAGTQFAHSKMSGEASPTILSQQAASAFGEKSNAAEADIVCDDPDEVVERIAPYVELGSSHLVFHGPGHDQERFLRGLCGEVLPRPHDRFGAQVPA